MPRPNGHFYNTIPAFKAQRLFWKREQRDCKSQRTRKSAVRLCLLKMLEKLDTHKVSSTWLPKEDLKKTPTDVLT